MAVGIKVPVRRFAFDNVDEALFSLALLEAFPNAMFYNGGRPWEQPAIDARGSLCDCESPVIGIFMPRENWEPSFATYKGYPGWFKLENPPRRSLHVVRSWWNNGVNGGDGPKWAFDWPTLEFGSISANIKFGDPEQKEFVATVWKIMAKLGANKYSTGYISNKKSLGATKRRTFWIGNHALAWCREGNRRMVMGYAHPCADWNPPDTAWHRDLNARFESWRQRWPDGVVPKLPTDRSELYA